MLRTLLICVTLVNIVQAQNLDEIISHSLSSHNSLKVIEQRLSAVEESLELTRNFQNPQISLGISDIQFADPLSRALEPMQATSLTFKQKIPYFGKRDASTSLVQAKKETIFESFEAAKVALVKEIKITAYTIWEYEQKLKIVDEYIELSNKDLELSNIYSSSGKAGHMESMSVKLVLSQLKIKKSYIRNTLSSLYERISYLSAQSIDKIELDVSVTKPIPINEYANQLKNNKFYKISLSQIKEKESFVNVRELDFKVDPVVSVGYYQRDERDNYVNINVGIALPIYGSETLKVQRARKDVLQSSLKSNDLQESLKAQLRETYTKLIHSYNAFTIINEESLPSVEHMFELTNTMLKNGNNLLLYTNLLERKLSLDEQRIESIASYRRNLSNITALIGDTK